VQGLLHTKATRTLCRSSFTIATRRGYVSAPAPWGSHGEEQVIRIKAHFLLAHSLSYYLSLKWGLKFKALRGKESAVRAPQLPRWLQC
jgi:hypothetical protein